MVSVQQRLAVVAASLVMALTYASCAKIGTDDLSLTLQSAGENRAELEAVLAHYGTPEDSLKLRAAEFLIANMAEHSYATYKLVDTSGNRHDIDVLSYPDFDELITAIDSVEEMVGELDFKRDEKILDAETISSELLIENIDFAFRAWRERPWAGFLTFEQFCQYVAPYRGSNEPLESWRPYYWKKYQPLIDSLGDISDPVVAAKAINTDIRTWFGFDRRYYLHPTDQGHSEMLATGLGRCEDMTNLTIFAMRANGLAVTSDYTPHWANSGNNHAWNAILLPGGRVVPFMGAESDPGDYSLQNAIAKAYRKTFAQQKGNLAFLPHKQEKVPRWLAGKNYVDVTTAYTQTSDVTIPFDDPIPDSVDIAYLTVFNDGEWKAIHWGRIRGDSVTFDAMGTGVLYLPALYLNEEISPVGAPFILADDGSTKRLAGDTDDVQSVTITATTHRAQAGSTDGVSLQNLEDGAEYELFYFTREWESLGQQTHSGERLVFGNCPAGALYWLTRVDGRSDERVFELVNGEPHFW